VVFASSRQRPLDQTSLWIARLGADVAPSRLTTGPGIDSHPVWSADGRSLVFASTRDGGDFDLWQLAIGDGSALGQPVQLTSGAGHEITPTIARDGTIAFTVVTETGPRAIDSHLELRTPNGEIRRLTAGPADSSPAYAPDGRALAFARPRTFGAAANSELWILALDTHQATPVVELPLTEDSGPVWSPDGRFLFATSVLRNSEGQPLISSVVYVDLQATVRQARLLRDRAGSVTRLTPAIAGRAIDAATLVRGREYLPELARMFAAMVDEQRANIAQ
jgi:Tol biopolymer transport system component